MDDYKLNERSAAYIENEINANRHMTLALAFTALLLFFVFFGYIFKAFDVSYSTYVMTIIIIPIVIVILCVPLFFINSDRLSEPYYKYALLFCFILGISILNIIMPKHAILGWAVCVILTSHYYSPKVTRIVFVTVILMMPICIGAGMFFGEFDANLLSGELREEDQTIVSLELTEVYPDTAAGRYQYMNDLIAVGENRYIKVYTQYFVGRALFLTLLYVITVVLNRRTEKLLSSEIKASNEIQKQKTELEVAKEIQLSTLPEGSLTCDEAEITGTLTAAKEVGGDLYDYMFIDDDHIAVLNGDVSGKGIPAAMFMMKTITSFRDFATADKTPSRILKEINASIRQGNKPCIFVTCFLMIIDKRSGKVIYSNAGHNPPVIGSAHDYRYMNCGSGVALGCFENVPVEDEEIVLQPGETITLYTDGITEARNNAGAFYGTDRLLQTFNRKSYLDINELHRAIKDDVDDFVQDAPQSDDIAFVTLRYR